MTTDAMIDKTCDEAVELAVRGRGTMVEVAYHAIMLTREALAAHEAGAQDHVAEGVLLDAGAILRDEREKYRQSLSNSIVPNPTLSPNDHWAIAIRAVQRALTRQPVSPKEAMRPHYGVMVSTGKIVPSDRPLDVEAMRKALATADRRISLLVPNLPPALKFNLRGDLIAEQEQRSAALGASNHAK